MDSEFQVEDKSGVGGGGGGKRGNEEGRGGDGWEIERGVDTIDEGLRRVSIEEQERKT